MYNPLRNLNKCCTFSSAPSVFPLNLTPCIAVTSTIILPMQYNRHTSMCQSLNTRMKMFPSLFANANAYMYIGLCSFSHQLTLTLADAFTLVIILSNNCYSTIVSFHQIRSRERAKYATVIHCSVPV